MPRRHRNWRCAHRCRGRPVRRPARGRSRVRHPAPTDARRRSPASPGRPGRHQFRIGEAGGGIVLGVARDRAGLLDGRGEAVLAQVGGAGAALALAEVHGDGDAAVARGFDRFHRAHAHVHLQAGVLGTADLGLVGAGARARSSNCPAMPSSASSRPRCRRRWRWKSRSMAYSSCSNPESRITSRLPDARTRRRRRRIPRPEPQPAAARGAGRAFALAEKLATLSDAQLGRLPIPTACCRTSSKPGA